MPFLTQGKTNWKFIGIVVVLAIVVGGGVWWWQWFPSEEKRSDTERLSSKSFKEEINYFINLGKEKADIAVCDGIKNIRQKALCYGGVAGAKKDLRICTNLEEEIEIFLGKVREEESAEKELKEIFSRTELKAIRIDGYTEKYTIYPIIFGYCLGGAATSQNEADICNWHQSISESLWCHYLLAAATEDLSACLAITKSPYEKAYCYLIVGKEPQLDLCKDVEQDYEGYKDMCYLSMIDIFEIEDPNFCKKLQFPVGRYYCEMEFQKDDSMCENIEDLGLKERCYSEIARKLKEPLICEKIKEKEERDECYNAIAEETKNPDTCDKIYDLTDRDWCYLSVVENISICRKIQEQEVRDRCYSGMAKYLKDASICEELQKLGWRDGCYRSMARELEDASMCEEIKDSTDKTVCYREAVDRAVASEDISICNQVQDQRYRDWCSKRIAGTLTEVNICEKLQDILSQDYCYSEIAKNIKDISVCDKVQWQPFKDGCYLDFAAILADLNICQKIEGSKDSCYWRVAKALKDVDICYLTLSPHSLSSCIRNIAETLKDEKICQKISASGVRDGCYWALAKIKKDINICELIQGDLDNNKCHKELGITLGLTKEGWTLPE